MEESKELCRGIEGVFMNWKSYEKLLNIKKKEKGKDKLVADMRIIPLGDRFYTTRQLYDAFMSLGENKRTSFYSYCVDGLSQAQIAKSRKNPETGRIGVSQAQIWWEIEKAREEIINTLMEISD